MLNFLLEVAPAEGGLMATIGSFLPIVLLVLVFYFVMIRPQNKREKKTQEMRNSLEVGDEVITSGGIIGRVVSLREDSLVIESGADNNKLRVAKWAIQANNTPRAIAPVAKEKEPKKEKE